MKPAFDRSEISQFYGTFREEEGSLKLNLRHYSVFKHIVDAGLRRNDKVLEIGCGFGTITFLMARYLSRGKIVATDISSERIASCMQNFQKRTNVAFVLSDMTDFVATEQFDMIVLPDVLEHIPVDSHFELFALMAGCLKDSGSIVIHIPHPATIEYYQRKAPESLQIIDQAISADVLTKLAYANGLRLELLQSYTLANHPYDYQLIIFRKNIDYNEMPSIGNWAIRFKKLKLRFWFWKTII